MDLTLASSGPAIEIIEKILDEPGVLFIAGMIAVAIVAIVFGSITGMIKSLTRERTRREIAAYIAEGSMTPEQGERLMKARASDDDDDD